LTNKSKIISIIDHDKMRKLLFDENWTEVYNKNNANECFSEFLKIITTYINKSTTSKKITSKNFRLKEWMTAAAGLLCYTRHKQSLSLKLRTTSNNIKLALHYKKYKNKYTQILTLAKKPFMRKNLSAFQTILN